MIASRSLRRRKLIGMFLTLSLLPACSPGQNGDGRGPYRLTVTSGGARVTHEGRQVRVTSGHNVSAGDTVSVPVKAAARLTLDDGWVLELAGADIRILSAERVDLVKGSLLADTRRPLQVAAGKVVASAQNGVFRIDRDLAIRVGVYSGRGAVVQSGGERLSVPRYRQAVIAGGIVPRAPSPLQFSAQDPWDRRLLAGALDLDARLANFARGLEAQLGDGSGLEFFKRTSPEGQQLDFLQPYLVNRRSDLLIGLLVAFESVKSAPAPFDQRFTRIFGLSGEGATWGLIAQEFSVSADSLFAQLAEAISRAKITVIGPGPGLLRPGPPARRPRPPAPARPSRPAPVAPPPASAAPPSPTAPLPPAVTGLLPKELKDIVDDLYGVVDPVLSPGG